MPHLAGGEIDPDFIEEALDSLDREYIDDEGIEGGETEDDEDVESDNDVDMVDDEEYEGDEEDVDREYDADMDDDADEYEDYDNGDDGGYEADVEVSDDEEEQLFHYRT